MRKTFTLLFVVMSCAVNAQFSVQPKIGLENSRTIIRSNEFASFAPAGLHFAPQLAVNMSYKFKSGHGAFFGVSSSSQAVAFNFTDAQLPKINYTASAKELQLRLEGGYQFTTKPISLGNTCTGARPQQKLSHGEHHNCQGNRVCGQHLQHGGCSRNSNTRQAMNKGWFMRITPSAGLAYIPGGDNGIETENKAGQVSYQYNATWKTAFITGAAFEFGSRRQTKFVVSVNYLKSLDNNEQTINTISNGKATSTSFSSAASGFNVGVGIPLNFKKHRSNMDKRQFVRPEHPYRCGQYHMCNH